MKKTLIVLTCIIVAFSFMLLATACDTSVELPDKPFEKPSDGEGDSNLIFEDNFDGNTLDTNVWKSHLGDSYMRRGAYYTMGESNVFVKDGHLTIRTNYQTDGKYGEGWYTGFIDTNPNPAAGFKGFATTYGYIEISCIAPPTHGIWSAFWMMPAGNTVAFGKDDVLGTGADGVEIDIMESPFYFESSAGSTQHVLHGDSYHDPIKKTDASKKYTVPGLYEKFNTFGVLWTEDEYVFNINGKETWRTKHTVGDVTLGTSSVPEYLLLSVEVLGDIIDGKAVAQSGWAGDPNKNNKSKNFDFVIDYVRVYQLDK